MNTVRNFRIGGRNVDAQAVPVAKMDLHRHQPKAEMLHSGNRPQRGGSAAEVVVAVGDDGGVGPGDLNEPVFGVLDEHEFCQDLHTDPIFP